MCKKCDNLLNVPVGEKRRVILEDDKNVYGAKVSETIMVVDNYGDKVEAFIRHLTVLLNDYNYGTVLDIKYCPFCGEKLV